MERLWAIVLTIILVVIVAILSYYKAHITWYSSLILALLLGLIVLNICYPATKAARECADWTLVIYGVFQCLAVIAILVYLLCICLLDSRDCTVPNVQTSSCGQRASCATA